MCKQSSSCWGWLAPLAFIATALTVLFAVIVFTFRFLSGRPMDGKRRTDSTFLKAGTKGGDALSRPSRWSMLPGWQRAAWRLLGLALVAGEVYGKLVHPVGLARVNATALHLGVVAGVGYAVVSVRRWRLRTQIIEPLADALRPALGLPETVTPRQLLRVPRSVVTVPPTRIGGWIRRSGAGQWAGRVTLDLVAGQELGGRLLTAWQLHADQRGEKRSAKRPVRITLPRTWPGADPRIVDIASTRLRGDEWAASWKLAGAKPVLELRIAPRPPARALWADYLSAVEMSGPTELMLGPTVGMRPVRIDLDSDVPHVLLSMGTGAGKSVTAKTLGMQALRKGWAVVVLDLKQESHPWAKKLIRQGVAGVTYCRKAAEVHDALLALDAEMEARGDIREEDEHAQFQRVLVIAEELNLTANRLREHWQLIKPKGAPAKSPAVAALANLTYAGRSFAMHVLAVGQMLTANTMGGPEARENFGCRILGRYTRNNWMMLVPECLPIPRSSKIRGRVQVCIAGEATATQVLYATDEEAVAYASGGIDAGDPPGVIPFRLGDVPEGTESADTHSDRGFSGGQSPNGDTLGVPEPRRYTLAEACATDVISANYEAARKARLRSNGSFPAGETVGSETTYTAEELQEWDAGRTRSGATQ
jgi:hypothetical protein